MFFLRKMAFCCCGCTLRTGALIVGIVELLYNLLIGTITIILMYITKNEKISCIDHFNWLMNNHYNPGFECSYYNTFIGIYISCIIFNGLTVILSCILLHGVVMSKTNVFEPWIIFNIINTLGLVISIIVHIVTSIDNDMDLYGILGSYYAAAIFGLRWFDTSIVYSYYLKMKDIQTTFINPSQTPHQINFQQLYTQQPYYVQQPNTRQPIPQQPYIQKPISQQSYYTQKPMSKQLIIQQQPYTPQSTAQHPYTQ